MDYKNIEALLEKYWQAETTLDEENKLRDFFCYGIVPPHLEEFKPLFKHITTSRQAHQEDYLQDEFDTEILNKLANNEKTGWWKRFNQPLKIAASVIVIFLVGWGVYTSRPDAVDQSSHITYEDPQRAYRETKRALLMMSLNLNRGANHASESLSKMDSAQNIIKEKLIK